MNDDGMRGGAPEDDRTEPSASAHTGPYHAGPDHLGSAQPGPDPTEGHHRAPEVRLASAAADRSGGEGAAQGGDAYALALGRRLRAVRIQQGMSLAAVEERSGGQWKAVVVGSYERGDRAVSVRRLADLAEFYGIPTSELLPEMHRPVMQSTDGKIVLNLEELSRITDPQAGVLSRYVRSLQAQRGDYNGRMLSIRAEDVRALAVMYDMTADDLTAAMGRWGVLITTAADESAESDPGSH